MEKMILYQAYLYIDVFHSFLYTNESIIHLLYCPYMIILFLHLEECLLMYLYTLSFDNKIEMATVAAEKKEAASVESVKCTDPSSTQEVIYIVFYPWYSRRNPLV